MRLGLPIFSKTGGGMLLYLVPARTLGTTATMKSFVPAAHLGMAHLCRVSYFNR